MIWPAMEPAVPTSPGETSLPHPHRMRGLAIMAALLAVVAAGEGGPARLDAESVERIIRALRGLRLEDDARRIAVEALLAGAPG